MRLLPKLEVIGPPDCPLMHRWTPLKGRWGKLMIHHFMPDATDPDCHDHPWAFSTLVLKGGYNDLVPCGPCDGEGHRTALVGECDERDECCSECHGSTLVLGDRLRAGSIRHRAAKYSHSTSTDHRGAWTVVFARPQSRNWGFWREGRWWPYRDYENRFGFVTRCEDR